MLQLPAAVAAAGCLQMVFSGSLPMIVDLQAARATTYCAAAAAAADYTTGVEGFSYNYYEDLTPKDACDIIDTLRKGEQQ
jgi:hypothetical protein